MAERGGFSLCGDHTRKTVHRTVFSLARTRNLWLLAPNSNPSLFFSNKKRPSVDGLILLAEKEGFEPSLHLSHTTPLAGEPLEPLGYFSFSVYDMLSQNFSFVKVFFIIYKFFENFMQYFFIRKDFRFALHYLPLLFARIFLCLLSPLL